MAPHDISSKVKNSEESINIEGLEALIERSLDDNKLKVVGYEAIKLLPTGENYCSVLIKLDMKIRRNETEEIYHLVAKTPSPQDNSVIDWSLIFKKELFMYTQIHPLYRELEREAGIEEHQLINAWPKYIGHRNSLKDNDAVDEYSAMLMENIKTQGFGNVDRKCGMDIEHASKALTVLARFHALGIVMKQRRPEFAQKTIEQARISGLDDAFMDRGYDSVLETIMEMPCFQKYLSIVKSSFERSKGGKLYKMEPSEPWASISHGDFWANNMLFHKDEAGNVDDVKFVDFQMYRYTSSLADFVYFVIGSLDATAQTRHLRDLIDLYYESFVGTLDRMNCDTSPFTRESFDRELKKQAIEQLPLCALATKFFVFEVNNDDYDKSGRELGNVVFGAGISNIFEFKLKSITEMYEKMGWF